ncbi:carboxylating nicotinate-nucleotide diphosphorylase [Maritalea myrionectae]|uniref:Probable nicotinate-nucleotide pyrophosphorylase [carboxylating] n=1 Tax=Maritalea myrionectae TaxID=454601 RepID=A0A2R4MG81_9HYPH|nr:nicotinate-nucleotide diphosphorylase (carboxylating) [Maritalea myrionectae]
MASHQILPAQLAQPLIRRAVDNALLEDLGQAGDITTQATLSPDATAVAVMNVREAGIISGIELARAAFAQIGDGLKFEAHVTDGDAVLPGQDIATISGNARLIMSAERVALNFMCHMSGISTFTKRYVDEVAGTGAKICCTRKTTPGLRAFEKFAVKCGGGANHRFGLDDAILIKDNHIAVAGGVKQAVLAAKAFAGHMIAIEVEVDTLEQFADALDAGATAVLLDNMSPKQLREAVHACKGAARLEASGGINLDSVRKVAETGVEFISTSQITMAASPLDIGLDIKINDQE